MVYDGATLLDVACAVRCLAGGSGAERLMPSETRLTPFEAAESSANQDFPVDIAII